MSDTKMIGPLVFPQIEDHFHRFARNVEDYQKPQRDVALTFVKDRRLCIDVGAHVGIFSRHFAQHFDRVLAFEPVLELQECLRQNVPDNVEVDGRAIGDRTGLACFLVVRSKNTGCSFVHDERARNPAKRTGEEEILTVEMVSIDDLELEHLGLIKIDVQGFDHFVLRGAMETLNRLHPVVMIEEKPVGGPTGPTEHIVDIQEMMRDAGYECRIKVGADAIYYHKSSHAS